MRARIYDQQALRSVSPLDLVSYLRSHGWTDVEPVLSDRRRDFVLTDGEHGEYEVSVPMQSTFRDFAMRVAEMLETLEIVEERSQLEILSDITAGSIDLVRISPDILSQNDGTLSLEQGTALVHHVHDVILAAACAAVRPQKLFTTRKPGDAIDYMKKAKLGQTERGSFVLTVHSPVTPNLQQGMFQPDMMPQGDIPFERRVMQTLFRSLQATRDAAIEGMSTLTIEPFTEKVPQGISANLLESIAALSEQTEATRLSFRISWARVRAASPTVPTAVEINRETVPVIKDAAAYLKRTSPIERTEIEGIPYQLTSGDVSSGGEIVIPTILEGKQKKVRVLLEPAQYQQAVNAHRNNLFVRCEGTVRREGNIYYLDNPTPLEVESTEEDWS